MFGIDWEGFVRPKLIELLNRLGYPWPTSDPDALRRAGGEWDTFASNASSLITELEGEVRALSSNNDGQALSAAVSYLQGPDSNVTSLRSIVTASPLIAAGFGLAADVVVALRLAVIGEILLDAIQLGLAILTGGISAGASFLVKQGAGAVIDYLLDTAIAQIMGA